MSDANTVQSTATHTPGLPPGNHPLEVAARQGFGPLSPRGQTVWHGGAMPCVTCGALVHRDDIACEHCGQDLSEEMLARMRQHAGPWYVLEHVRPFPGVSLELIIRQIQRGLITETSILRGPATDYQWRFAVETPGLCRYFLRCWKCHAAVTPTAAYCEGCLFSLTYEEVREKGKSAVRAPVSASRTAPITTPAPAAATPGRSDIQPASIPDRTLRDSLSELTAALDKTGAIRREEAWEEPPRVAGLRATWVAILILVLTVLTLVWIASTRNLKPSEKSTRGGSALPVAPQAGANRT